MRCSIIEPLAPRPRTYLAPKGSAVPLGQLLTPAAPVSAVRVNGTFLLDWPTYQPAADDQIDIFLARPTNDTFLIIAGILVPPLGIAYASFLAAQWLLKQVFPAPRQSNSPFGGTSTSRPEESFGITGLTNTIAPGTPKFIVYGQRRVFGHLIGTGVQLAGTGKGMNFSALYMMGDTGGDEYEAIDDIELNDIKVADVPGVTTAVRLGASVQTVLAGFEEVTQVFSDGRSLVYNTPLTYTTKGSSVSRAQVILAYPGGLRKVDTNSGADLAGKSQIKVERKLPADVGWTVVSTTTIEELSLSALYRAIEVTFPSVDQWQLRVTELHDKTSTTPQTITPDAALFNVQEIQATTKSYPGHALLAVYGVASAQIQSLDSLRVSALVKGKKVKVWDGASFTLQWTQERAWICRDLLTHPTIGLGHRVPESMHDDGAALAMQAYWNDPVPALNDGTEVRDQCDVIINERRSGWDWLRDLLSEGRGTYLLSAGKFKLVIDRPGTPNLLWSMPGNILEGSLKAQVGHPSKSVNTVRGQYADADQAYKVQVVEVQAADIGDDPVTDQGFTYISLTRVANVLREIMYQLKRQRLTRHWTWTASPGALVSEPLDLDSLSYDTTDVRRGQSGFVGAPAAADTLLLDRPVRLESGTYEVLLRKPDNTMQRRTLATGVGTWGRLAVTVPFDPAPAAGDIYAVGLTGTQILPVQIQSVKANQDGGFDLAAQEYADEVYELDDYPEIPDARYIPTVQYPPIALRDAQVREQVISNADGSWASTLYFDVTPGLSKVGGAAQAGGASTITLESGESGLDGYYNEAEVEIVGGTGSGQTKRIGDYVGSTRVATVDSAWATNPDNTSQYTLTWLRYAPLGGFIVEEGLSSSGPWSEIGRYSGTTGKAPAAGPNRTTYFRFTPLSDAVIPNTRARIVKTITLAGDVTPPAAPTAVDVSSYQRNLVVVITMARPTAVDLAGWEVEIYKDAISGSPVAGPFKVSAPGQDDAGSGSMTVRSTFAMPESAAGDVLLARARSVDGANNQSGWTNSGSTILTAAANQDEDILESDHTNITTEEEILSVEVTTAGGKVLILQNIMVEGDLGLGQTIRLKRDSTVVASVTTATMHAVRLDQPAAGTYTYSVTVESGGDILLVPAGANLTVCEFT